MSYRLIYTTTMLKQIGRSPGGLADCIRFHLGEMERAESLPGVRISFPHPEGMGYYFVCREPTSGTTYQLLARYRVGQDEESLVLLGLGCYPLAD